MIKKTFTKIIASVCGASMIIALLGSSVQAAGAVKYGRYGIESTSTAASDEASSNCVIRYGIKSTSTAASDEVGSGTKQTEANKTESIKSAAGLAIRSGIAAATSDEADLAVASVVVQESYYSLGDDMAISNVESFVYVREEPNSDSEALGKVYAGCSATILDTDEEEDGEWYYIESGSVTGYIKASYFLTGEEAADYAMENGKVFTVNTADGLRVHESADLNSETVMTMYEQQTAKVDSIEGGFLKVTATDYEGEEVTGYIHSGYTELYVDCETAISIEEEQAIIAEQERIAAEEAAAAEAAAAEAAAAAAAESEAAAAAARAAQTTTAAKTTTAAQTTTAAPTTASQSTTTTQKADTSNLSSARAAVVNYAYSKLGCAYVWGASGPNSFDCSGLVMCAYAQVGITLSHYSGSQAQAGTYVPISEAQPGDILYKSGHVGIYVGDGKVIHASTSRTGVILSSVSSGSWVGARNVLG